MGEPGRDFEDAMAEVMDLIEKSKELEAYLLARELETDAKRWSFKQRQRYQSVSGYLLRLLGGRGEWPPEDHPEADPNDPAGAVTRA
jgi:hypothetical protein